MIRSKVVAAIESSPLENIDVKDKIFLACGFNPAMVNWVAANYWETKEFINWHLEDKGLEVLTIGFSEDWDGENTVYTLEAKLMPIDGEWGNEEEMAEERARNDLHLFIEEMEAMENKRLYEEFEELANEGEFDEEEELDEEEEHFKHFIIWAIPNEIKAWVEENDYEARQILDNAVPTDEGFQVVGWQWERRVDFCWNLIAELEY